MSEQDEILDEIEWRDVSLGVISWDERVKGYVLRIDRDEDLPLSFNVWTKVGRSDVESVHDNREPAPVAPTGTVCATCGHRIYNVGFARWAHAMDMVGPEHEAVP